MAKYYQPIVLEKCEVLMSALHESNFFEEYNIKDINYAKEYFCDLFTEKFIQGKINDDFEELLPEEELEQCLKEICAVSVINELVAKGYAQREEKDGKEFIVLTEEGKEYVKQMRMNGDLPI